MLGNDLAESILNENVFGTYGYKIVPKPTVYQRKIKTGYSLIKGQPFSVDKTTGQIIPAALEFSSRNQTDIYTRSVDNTGDEKTGFCQVDPATGLHAIAYRDVSSGYTYMIMFTILKDGTFVRGIEQQLDTGVGYSVRLLTLSTTKILVALTNGSNLRCAIITVNGTTVSSIDSWTTIFPASTYYVELCKIDSTHVIITYRNASGYACAKVLTITGIIGSTSEQVLVSKMSFNYRIEKIDATRYLFLYGDGSVTPNTGNVAVLTLSETTLSIGTSLYISTAQSSSAYANGAITVLSTTKAFVSYNDSVWRMAILTISDNSVTLTYTYSLGYGATNTSIVKLTNNILALCMRSNGLAYPVTINADDTVTLGTVSDNSRGQVWTWGARLDDYHMAHILPISGGYPRLYLVQLLRNVQGIAKVDGTSEQTIDCYQF